MRSTSEGKELRPPVDPAMPRAEFERWYWPVIDLEQFCDHLGVSKSGRKAELRDRVARALDGDFETKPTAKKQIDKFDWSNADLSLETRITGSISFGPNVRRFFKTAIGPKFICHSDFMDWVRLNTGLMLADAIEAWRVLEERKTDPEFRREIASCNNYLQYLRDLRDANPAVSLSQAKQCWEEKKIRPAAGGEVVYEPTDLRFIKD